MPSSASADQADSTDELYEDVPDRRSSSRSSDLPQEGSAAALRMERRRRWKYLPWLLVAILLVGNIIQPIFFAYALATRHEIALMDTNSNLVVSPLLEPMSSSKVQELCFTWASKGFLDRNPGGFDNPLLLDSYFTQSAREKANADWLAQEPQAKAKQIFQDFSPFQFSIQGREGGRLRVRVDGQLRVQAIDNGALVTEPRPVAVEFTFSSNPNLGGNKFFPLMVETWRYLDNPLPLPGA